MNSSTQDAHCINSEARILNPHSREVKDDCLAIMSSEYHVLHMMQNKHRKLTGQGTNKDASPCCPALGSSGLWTISKGASCCIVGKTTGKTSLLSSSSTFTFCVSCKFCIFCIFCKTSLLSVSPTFSWCWSCCGGGSGQGENTGGIETVGGRYPTRMETCKILKLHLIVRCTLATSTLSQGSLGLASVILQTTWST